MQKLTDMQDLEAAVLRSRRRAKGNWICACDGIGRHARFRFSCSNACGFESLQAHHIKRRYEIWTFLLKCLDFISSLFMLKPSIHAGFGIFSFMARFDCLNRQTLKNYWINRRKTAFEPPCLFSLRCLPVKIQVFIGIWRSIPQRGMWTLHIIEIYVFSDAFFELFHRMIVPPIQFLPF